MTTGRSVLLVCTCLVLVLIATGMLSGWIAPSEHRPGDPASELGLSSQPPYLAEFVTPKDNGPAPLTSFSNGLPALNSEPSVPVLFEALLRAVDAQDGPAARSFRERLMARGQDEVRAEALRLLAVQRHTRLTAGSTRTEQVSTRARLSNLQFFIAPVAPDAAFEELRKRWSDPLIAGENLKRWHEVEKLPVDHLACVALDVACQVEAESIGRFLEDDLAGGGRRSGAVYSWLTLKYEQGNPTGEIPDAWLSQMMICLTTQSLEASGNNALQVKKWLVSIRQGPHFSRRLRAQAAALLCAAPDSFWQLMDGIASAIGTAEVASMLRGFLAQRALSVDEAQLLVEMLRTQFASDPNALWRLMLAVVGSTTDGKLIENTRCLAGTFILVASSASDELTALAAVNATSALRFAWGHKSRATASRRALLNSTSGLTLDGLITLYKTLLSKPAAGNARLRATAAARVFEFIWVFDAPVTDRLATCRRMLEIASTVPPTGFSAIVNGLDKIVDDLDFTHSDSVSTIISSLGAKCVSLELRQTPQKDLPVKHNAWESIVLRQLASVLAKVSFPPLGDAARRLLVDYAKAVQAGFPAWNHEEPGAEITGNLATQVLTAYE